MDKAATVTDRYCSYTSNTINVDTQQEYYKMVNRKNLFTIATSVTCRDSMHHETQTEKDREGERD